MSFTSRFMQPIANGLDYFVTYLEIKSLKKDLKAGKFGCDNSPKRIEYPYTEDVQIRIQAKRELELIAQNQNSKYLRNLAKKALAS